MIEASSARPAASGWTTARQQWAIHLAVLFLLLAILFVLNLRIVAAALTVWEVSPTYSHCFFLIPVSAFLIWKRRKEISVLRPSSMPSALWLALPLIAIQLAGFIASITEIQQIAFIGLAQVAILAVLGRRIYSSILFPLLFLFFLVPMGEYLVTPMQNFTAWFISAGLSLMGILHHTEGTVIELVNGTFRVAEACAGLRFLIATIAVGSLFAYLNYRKWYKIVLYMIASVIVPIIGNGLRALGIVLLAHFSNNRIATGADHLVYGWGFSVAILCLLMVVGVRFADPIVEASADSRTSEGAVSSHGLIWTAMLAALCMFAVPAFAYWNNHRPAVFDKTALVPPAPANGWTIKSASGDWRPDFANPDAVLSFGLMSPNAVAPGVDVAVDYYARSREGHGLISSANRFWADESWHLLSEGSLTAVLNGQPVPLTEIVIATPGRTELIWWTYWANGRFTTSATTVKLGSLKTVLGGAGGSAVIAISTILDSDEDSARARLQAALPSLSDLPRRLRLAAGIADSR